LLTLVWIFEKGNCILNNFLTVFDPVLLIAIEVSLIIKGKKLKHTQLDEQFHQRSCIDTHFKERVAQLFVIIEISPVIVETQASFPCTKAEVVSVDTFFVGAFPNIASFGFIADIVLLTIAIIFPFLVAS